MYGLTSTMLVTFYMESPDKDALYYALGMEVIFLIVSVIGTSILAINWRSGEKIFNKLN